MKSYLFGATLVALAASPAVAGKPIAVADGITLTPIADARLRAEIVDQDNSLREADAVTLRLRAGVEIDTASGFGALAESEGTLAIGPDYNSTTNGRTGYSTVADPQNVEINRFQLHYRSKPFSLTVGRQRINLDDQRFVGSVGWRQNEQTFDAARAQAVFGPVSLDATYAISQRTIFGVDAGPRQHYDGHFVFLGAGTAFGSIKVKGFAYLLDYDPGQPVSASSTQTYGLRATSDFKLTPGVSLKLAASYASQSNYESNPANYSVDYIAAEASLGISAYGLTAGYERLGSDNGNAFQTPMATLHKFNGWADMFLTTPGQGLQDFYVGAHAKFAQVKALPGLHAAVTWHDFESDAGDQKFGSELDGQIGFKLTKRINLLAKYASFDRTGISKFAGDVSTRKFWLQAEFSL